MPCPFDPLSAHKSNRRAQTVKSDLSFHNTLRSTGVCLKKSDLHYGFFPGQTQHARNVIHATGTTYRGEWYWHFSIANVPPHFTIANVHHP